jgi:hypothetical protein
VQLDHTVDQLSCHQFLVMDRIPNKVVRAEGGFGRRFDGGVSVLGMAVFPCTLFAVTYSLWHQTNMQSWCLPCFSG